jgi:hypothetical protein
MSPKDVVFTTKPFEYEAFVTTISDSKTVPSFEELRTKVLNQGLEALFSRGDGR